MSERKVCELIVALDTADIAEAEAWVKSLRPEVRWFKVGLELFSAAGPAAIAMVRANGGQVFVDLKLHDIPNTVQGAASSLVRAGCDMFNVHAGGGRAMMTAAANVAGEGAGPKPLALAVTVLTSLDRAAWAETYGVDSEPLSQVVHLAHLAQAAGLDGVVCSVHEAAAVRAACGLDFAIVTPGVRPGGADVNDQKRVATPATAVQAGATHIVVGRPVTRATDPRAAALAIINEMGEAVR